MPNFQVSVTRTTTEFFNVEAEDWESAEDIVDLNDIKPYHTKYGDAVFDTEEVDESR